MFERIESKLTDAPLNWSLEEKIYQMMIVDFQNEELEWLLSKPWGGVIIFDKNVVSAQQVAELNYRIMRDSLFPPFISVDQEGGTVFRIDFPSYPAPPSQMAIGNIKDMYAAKIAANINGRLLRALGFNLVFSPVLDVNTNPYNPIINVRAFGEHPIQAALYGKYAIRGYKEANIIAVGKHFPGHGSTSTDSHYTLPVVDKTEEELKRTDLFPFSEAITKANLMAIMTAHVLYPALDKYMPATLSKRIVTGLLREELGFKGVVFTDALNMLALKEYDMDEILISAVNAGCDELLVLGEDREVKEEAVRTLVKAVRRGFISEERVNEAVLRVIDLKRKSLLNTPEIDLEDETLQESVTFLRYITEHSVKVRVNDEKALRTFKPELAIIILNQAQERNKLHEPLLNRLLKIASDVKTEMIIAPNWGDVSTNPFSDAFLKAVAKRRAILAYYLRYRLEGEALSAFKRLSAELGPYLFINMANPYAVHDLEREPVAELYSYGYNLISQEVILDRLEELIR